MTGRRDAVNGRIARLFEGYGTVVSVTARAKPDAPVRTFGIHLLFHVVF